MFQENSSNNLNVTLTEAAKSGLEALAQQYGETVSGLVQKIGLGAINFNKLGEISNRQRLLKFNISQTNYNPKSHSWTWVVMGNKYGGKGTLRDCIDEISDYIDVAQDLRELNFYSMEDLFIECVRNGKAEGYDWKIYCSSK
ncbi:hypothetical protein [Floridanema aerugineum]|uniref:Uncharacterized protein n=1 Tax=Floridaenema aerugineum BLCC-F46 TaxID=3153654 RepID=A0ABV4X1T9_9CYAN